jgi:hypothetical protein
MSLRDHAFGALADQERAMHLAAETRKAQKHAEASQRTREFFSRLGTVDVVVDGSVFIMDDEDFHGVVGKDGAKVIWWTTPETIGGGGCYGTAEFHDLPSLGRALKKIDQARAAGTFRQQPPTRSEYAT